MALSLLPLAARTHVCDLLVLVQVNYHEGLIEAHLPCTRPWRAVPDSLSSSQFLFMQAAILLLGGATAVLVVVLRTQGGLQAVIAEGNAANKLSLGSWDWSWSQRTVPTVFTYGIVHYLGKFITFQVGQKMSAADHMAMPC